MSHLFTAINNRAAFAFGQIGNTQILLFKRDRSVQQNYDYFGEFYGPQTIPDAQLSPAFPCTLAFLRMPAVSKIRIGTAGPSAPAHSIRSEIASRVIPASGPVSKPFFAKDFVDQRRFCREFGRPTTATCNGFALVGTGT